MARLLALATLWTLLLGVVGMPASELELRPLAAVAALGVLGTGIAFLLMGFLVGRVGPPRSSFITYLVPVVALALGGRSLGRRVGRECVSTCSYRWEVVQ